MKKTPIILGGTLATLVVIGLLFSDQIQKFLLVSAIKPSHTFDEEQRPSKPDYQVDTTWAALPSKKDGADVSPQGTDLDQQDLAGVDVFFIHPTTLYSSSRWNQDLNDEEVNALTDGLVLNNQASVFNNCCSIYAPRYRQATLYSFFEENENSKQALDLAYQDVAVAFDNFLARRQQGRPFILASHSQGSLHLDRLLKEKIHNQELLELMIAAYPVGFPIDGSNGIDICKSASQLHCQVTWNSLGPDASSYRDTSNDICVNPISWNHDESLATADKHLGAVSFQATAAIEKNILNAQCQGGRLIITDIKSDNFSEGSLGKDNFHIHDYSFFHMDLRNNLKEKLAAFHSKLRETESN